MCKTDASQVTYVTSATVEDDGCIFEPRTGQTEEPCSRKKQNKTGQKQEQKNSTVLMRYLCDS